MTEKHKMINLENNHNNFYNSIKMEIKKYLNSQKGKIIFLLKEMHIMPTPINSMLGIHLIFLIQL